MEPGPVPVGQPGLGQQEAQCRGKKGMGEVGRSWKHQGEMPWVEEQKERQRGLHCTGLECQAKEPGLYFEGHEEPRKNVRGAGTLQDSWPPGPVFMTQSLLVSVEVWGA